MLISCYFTPSECIKDFQDKLDNLEDFLVDNYSRTIVAGDFNVKALEWGMSYPDSRGKRVMELVATRGLTILNVGNTTTFRRPGNTETIPDITFASEELVKYIKKMESNRRFHRE